MATATHTVDTLRLRVAETGKGPWFMVPNGTPEGDCARCDADALFWIVTTRGARMLVDCNVVGGCLPGSACTPDDRIDPSRDGRGVSHFATCPHAQAFRRRR